MDNRVPIVVAAVFASMHVAVGAQPAVPRPPMTNRITVLGPARNVLYGTIVRIAGTQLIVRSRDGRLHGVDAGPAFAAGTVSAPLFAGKPIVAEGVTRADGLLTAVRVSRFTGFAGANPDR